MKVSKLYGMLQPGESETAAVRAVFFIDPKGKIRLIMYYPLNVGRNMDEIKRDGKRVWSNFLLYNQKIALVQ